MRPRFQIKRWGIVLLAAWCLLFLHGENTQKSMVRAVLLEQQGTQWQVGLLYQAPMHRRRCGLRSGREKHWDVRFRQRRPCCPRRPIIVSATIC